MDTLIFPNIGEETQLPFYITGIGGYKHQGFIDRPNGLGDFQIIFTVKGSGTVMANNKVILLNENKAFLMHAEKPHKYYANDDFWETEWITFNGYGVEKFIENLNDDPYDCYYINNLELLKTHFNKLFINVSSYFHDRGYIGSQLLYLFLVEFNNIFGKIKSTSTFPHHLITILEYIEKNYNKDIVITELSSNAHISPQYLFILFQKHFKLRPFEYITKIRMQKSKQMLLSGKYSVNYIARQVGYNDTSYFCSIFKKNELLTPKEFARLYGVNAV